MSDTNIMTEYGPMPTEEEYRRRKLPGKAPIYELGVCKVGEKGAEEKLIYPFEVDSDGAPVDGSPYEFFETAKHAEECVKRIGGVLAKDYFQKYHIVRDAVV